MADQEAEKKKAATVWAAAEEAKKPQSAVKEEHKTEAVTEKIAEPKSGPFEQAATTPIES